MIRTFGPAFCASIAAAVLATAALAQGPRIDQSPQAPGAAATEIPGPTSDIIGPDGSFRLKPDGVNWERFQSVRSIGVRCTDKVCGGDRVFCMIQVRSVEGVKAGAPTSSENAAEFGAGVLKNTPKEMTAEYVTPFAEARFGPNLGQWAEVKAEGEPGKLRFGLFLTSVEKRLVAFNCVSPAAKWGDNEARFKALLASVEIPR